MITIGRQFSGQRGDYTARCDYCSVYWYRSQLSEDEAGRLYCPDEGEGLDETALTRENAEGATEYEGPRKQDQGGVSPQNEALTGGVDIRTLLGGGF